MLFAGFFVICIVLVASRCDILHFWLLEMLYRFYLCSVCGCFLLGLRMIRLSVRLCVCCNLCLLKPAGISGMCFLFLLFVVVVF